MTRRDFIAAAPVAVAAAALLRQQRMGLRYVGGPWNTHRYEVFFNGQKVVGADVPHGAQWSVCATDPRQGYLVRLKTINGKGTGGFYLTDKGEIPYEVLHGDVRVVERNA